MEYLGFWVTWTGIRPINNKVESIVNIIPLKNTKEVCALIVIVNCYRDMWDRRSHLLHPLTVLTPNKVKFKWTDVEQKALDYIKHAVVQENLLAYPGFHKHFDIHTDANNYQIRSSDYPERKTHCFLRPQTDRTAIMVYSIGKGIA